jgi:hypothetical protein
MPAADTSVTNPWLTAPPAVPRPETAKSRSPVLAGESPDARSSRFTLPLARTSRARSFSSCQVHSSALISASPCWTFTAGPGDRVAALTVLYEVTRSVCSESEATAKAVPTDGWPASSRVLTKNTESFTLSIRASSVPPSAWMRLSGSSSFWISATAFWRSA